MDNEFLRRQDKSLAAAQVLALKRIWRILEKARAETIGSLMSTPGGFQETAMLAMLANIDQLMIELRSQLGSAFRELVKESTVKGADDQMDLINHLYGDKLRSVTSDFVFAGVELKVLQTLELNTNEFLNRFTEGIREKIKNTIQMSFIHGRTEGETVKIIREQFGTQLAPVKRAVHHIYQTAYNAANHDVLVQMKENVPRLEKQWWSLMDNVTTEPCQNLHEQIKPVEDPFIEPVSGSKFMYPPAVYGNPSMKPQFHFCRSRAVPYIEGYE